MMRDTWGRWSVICHFYLGEEAGAGRSGFDLGWGRIGVLMHLTTGPQGGCPFHNTLREPRCVKILGHASVNTEWK
jgi:hypothetical protein